MMILLLLLSHEEEEYEEDEEQTYILLSYSLGTENKEREKKNAFRCACVYLCASICFERAVV